MDENSGVSCDRCISLHIPIISLKLNQLVLRSVDKVHVPVHAVSIPNARETKLKRTACPSSP